MGAQQFPGDTGILAGDEVGAAQDVEGAKPDVGEIADRARNEMELPTQRLQKRFDAQTRSSLARLDAALFRGRSQ